MDIGAYIGDSAYILMNKTTKRVFSYEISDKNFRKLLINQEKFHDRNRSKVFLKGIGSNISTISIRNCDKADCSLLSQGSQKVDISTLDHEVKTHNISLGFIKIDAEGTALNILKGGLKSILKYKPVMDIAIYHNYEEMFEVTNFVKNLPNYAIEFHYSNGNIKSFGEFDLFTYPFELYYYN